MTRSFRGLRHTNVSILRLMTRPRTQRRINNLLSLFVALSLLIGPFTAGPAMAQEGKGGKNAATQDAEPGGQADDEYGPPPGYVMPSPTPAPTVTPIPDTNYVDQEMEADRDRLLAEVEALPEPQRAGNESRVSTRAGGKVASADGKLKLGVPAGVVKGDEQINVKVERISFGKDDPRGRRNGQPLAMAYRLTATQGLKQTPVQSFDEPVTLVWNIDPAELAAAGVEGFPLKVYTFDEQSQNWVAIPSMWSPKTMQLVATTPHFSDYAAGASFDAVNNYLPTVNSFEVDLQTGAATMSYPINVPAGPGGFGPKVSLSYNSGNVDRVDYSQQGTSPVGWGWSLSTSYIAATQHTFGTFHPWTVSIVMDGASGDLIKDNDDHWHTADESFVKILYSGLPTDTWEAWDKNGTKYVFDLRTQTHDTANGNAWVTNRWMLDSATDVHGNVIYYEYKYQDSSANNNLLTTPISGNKTRAVYLWCIRYGGGGTSSQDCNNSTTKLKTTFNIVSRSIGGVHDISSNDAQGDLYQSYRIDNISIERFQAPDAQHPSGYYALLRAYDFAQNYSIVLTVDLNEDGIIDNSYRHLTLAEIIPRGNDDTPQLPGTQLPKTSFVYWKPGDPNYISDDNGHIWWAYNGYGGEVGFYYDAAGGGVTQSIRRVRAKKVGNGLGSTPPNRLTYRYDYHGATLNGTNISEEADHSKPLHAANGEFRGFGWVREQAPVNEDNNVYLSTDHYYMQEDTFKAKEWRVQAGKGITFTDALNAAPATGWTTAGVTLSTDPISTTNGVWKVTAVGSMQHNAPIIDGSDAAIRFFIKSSTPTNPDSERKFTATWKLENANGNGEYWGLKIDRKDVGGGNFQLHAQVIWRVGGTEGTRDLSQMSPYRPRRAGELRLDAWYELYLHTSPDGRFAVELQRADDGDYVQIKSGDAKDGGNVIPNMPTGKLWKFKHEVTQSVNFTDLVDDYAESRTIYSQSDSLFAELTAIGASGASDTQWRAGYENNADGMYIRFVPVTESSSTTYGAWVTQPNAVKRTKQTFDYDATYGNQIAIYDHGDLATSGDDRSTHLFYNNNPTSWIIGKLGHTNMYSTITGNIGGANFKAQVVNLYDYHSDSFDVTTKGELTEVRQMGLVNGTYTEENSGQRFHYDMYGNQDQAIDPLGNTTGTTFDTYYHSFPVATSYANGRQETTVWDPKLDVPSQTTDMNGTVTEHRYDMFGRPARSWTATGGFGSDLYPNERYVFEDIGEDSVTPPFYISLEKRVGTTDGTKTWQTRWFDGMGRTLSDVSPRDASNSIVVDSAYGSNGQLYSTSLPYAVTGASATATRTPDTSKPKLTKFYDDAGRVTEVRNADYPSNNMSRIAYDYNWLLCVGTWDEVNDRKYECNDARGRLADLQEEDWSQFSPNGLYVHTRYSYNALDQLVSVTRDYGGPNPATATISYDGLGRKSGMTDPDMGTWNYTYDAAGNLKTQEDALFNYNGTMYPSHKIFFDYDEMNRVTDKYYGQSHEAAGIADVKYYYDNDLGDAATMNSWGRLRKAEVTVDGQGFLKANTHAYEYDDRGLVTADEVQLGVSAPASNVTWANAVNVTVAGNTITKNNGVGWTSGAVSSQSIASGQDGYVEMTVTDANERMMFGLSHGDSDQTFQDIDYAIYTYPDGQLRIYEQGVAVSGAYGAYSAGDVLRVAVEGGVVRYYRNDTLLYTSATAPTYPLLLDSAICDVGVSVSNAKIYAGNFASSRTYSVSYAYDKGGRLTGVTYPNTGTTEQVTVGYNSQGIGLPYYMTSNATTAPPVASSAYNERGQLVTLAQGNSGTLNYLTTSYTYDDTTTKRGWLKRTLVTSNSGADVHLDLSLNYTLDGNISSVSSVKDAQDTHNISFTNSYLYDGFDRLRSASSNSGSFPAEAYNFDTLGRMTTRTIAGNTQSYVYGNTAHKDAPTSYTGVAYNNSYTYDAAGNQLTYYDSDTSTTQSRVFDAENRLMRIVDGATTSAATPTSEFVYDANGNRVLSSVSSNGSRVRTVYIGNLFEEELTGSANPPYINYYSFGDKMVGMRRANQTSMNGQYRMVSDHLGSATVLVDTAAPAVTVRREYSRAYGQIAYSWASGGSLTDIGYTGQRVEGTSGLMFYGARFYDPTLGYFASADTIGVDKGASQSRNRYSYVLNNPLRFIDPSGHEAQQDADSQERNEKANQLKRYGFDIQRLELWTVEELQALLNAIRLMMNKLHWSRPEQFQEAMGIDVLGRILLVREGVGDHYSQPGGLNCPSEAQGNECSRVRERNGIRSDQRLILLQGSHESWALDYGELVERNFVHELAHAWDNAEEKRTGMSWSERMRVKTGGIYVDGTYYPGAGAVSDYAETNPGEDWADSVAAYLYPGHYNRLLDPARKELIDTAGWVSVTRP